MKIVNLITLVSTLAAVSACGLNGVDSNAKRGEIDNPVDELYTVLIVDIGPFGSGYGKNQEKYCLAWNNGSEGVAWEKCNPSTTPGGRYVLYSDPALKGQKWNAITTNLTYGNRSKLDAPSFQDIDFTLKPQSSPQASLILANNQLSVSSLGAPDLIANFRTNMHTFSQEDQVKFGASSLNFLHAGNSHKSINHFCIKRTEENSKTSRITAMKAVLNPIIPGAGTNDLVYVSPALIRGLLQDFHNSLIQNRDSTCSNIHILSVHPEL